MFFKTLKVAIFVCKRSKVEFNSAFSFAFFSCQDERLLMRKRLGKGIFRPHQRMRDLWFSICGFFGLFQINIRQKASLCFLVFLERRISITIYVKAMWFYATEIFLVRFSSLCLHLFHFVNISLCVTHDVRRVSLYASVLISRAETSFLLPEVTVLSCSITGFRTCYL